MAKILLLDFDHTSGLATSLRKILESSSSLRAELHQTLIKISEPDFIETVTKTILSYDPDLIFFLLSATILGQVDALFKSQRSSRTAKPIIVVMEPAEPTVLVQILERGVAAIIVPPLISEEIIPQICRLLGQTGGADAITLSLKEKLGLRQLVGESPEFLAEIKKISRVSQCETSVLITGETGTGKELFARAIHYLSPRAGKPFVPISCGAVPLELLENEMFGHDRGAFTGASALQPGLIHEADGGTLLLDEIECLPLLAQAKCLRFLQEKEYRPLGCTKTSKANVRVIAATNVDLEVLVREGKFRRDLYYRLNVFPITLPPLRARRMDVPLLAHHFLIKYAGEFKKPVTDFSEKAMQKLMLYYWPGNVRELEHAIERSVILSDSPYIGDDHVVLPLPETPARNESFQEAKIKIIAQFEIAYIQGLLLAYHGNITRAADAAHKNRRAFWQLIRKHGINVDNFKM